MTCLISVISQILDNQISMEGSLKLAGLETHVEDQKNGFPIHLSFEHR